MNIIRDSQERGTRRLACTYKRIGKFVQLCTYQSIRSDSRL